MLPRTHIEAIYQIKLKTFVVFVDLIAALETVWMDGMIYKLLKSNPCSATTVRRLTGSFGLPWKVLNMQHTAQYWSYLAFPND